MPQTVTNIDSLLKDVYEGTVSDQLNSETRLLDMFKRQQVQPWEGRRIIRPLRTGRNEGVMATAEDNLLPNAGRQASAAFTIPIRYLHGRISITAQSIKHSKSNRGSFVRALEFELDNLISDLADDRNRIIANFGSGILCLVNTDPGTGTNLTVDAPGGFAGANNGTRFLQPGMEVAFVTPGGQVLNPNTTNNTRTITSITSGTVAVVNSALDTAIADNDEVVRGVTAAGAFTSAADIEPEGIFAGADNGTYVGTYHGLSRTTYPILNTPVISSVGALSTDALYRALHQADQQGSAKIDRILGSSDAVLEYVKLTEADRRYTSSGGAMSPDAGVKAAGIDWNNAVTFAGIPIAYDKDFPYGTLVGIDKRYWERYVLVAGEWVDDDGAVLFRDSNKDNFEARYRLWENFHCNKPVAQFRLDGVTTSVPTYHVF